jgi:hypothetical protein
MCALGQHVSVDDAPVKHQEQPPTAHGLRLSRVGDDEFGIEPRKNRKTVAINDQVLVGHVEGGRITGRHRQIIRQVNKAVMCVTVKNFGRCTALIQDRDSVRFRVLFVFLHTGDEPWSFSVDDSLGTQERCFSGVACRSQRAPSNSYTDSGYYHKDSGQAPVKFIHPVFRNVGAYIEWLSRRYRYWIVALFLFSSGSLGVWVGIRLAASGRRDRLGCLLLCLGCVFWIFAFVSGLIGRLPWDWWNDNQQEKTYRYPHLHSPDNVSHKLDGAIVGFGATQEEFTREDVFPCLRVDHISETDPKNVAKPGLAEVPKTVPIADKSVGAREQLYPDNRLSLFLRQQYLLKKNPDLESLAGPLHVSGLRKKSRLCLVVWRFGQRWFWWGSAVFGGHQVKPCPGANQFSRRISHALEANDKVWDRRQKRDFYRLVYVVKGRRWVDLVKDDPRSLASHYVVSLPQRSSGGYPRRFRLAVKRSECAYGHADSGNACEEEENVWKIFRRKQAAEVALRVIVSPIVLLCGALLLYHEDGRNRYVRFVFRGSGRNRRIFCRVAGFSLVVCGWRGITLPVYHQDRCEEYGNHRQKPEHNTENVSQKVLTPSDLLYYTKYMANVLSADKQNTTGVHRDTIMRLGVKVGKGCTALMDAKMRNLSCTRLECDDIWGYVVKKERHMRSVDDPQFGNVWTYCAIDADTKLVPTFRVAKDRSFEATAAFMVDVADRMKNRVQVSTDGLTAYVDAIDWAFRGNVDYGQIIKTYGTEEVRRSAAPIQRTKDQLCRKEGDLCVPSSI